jgi:hypothetical protein
MCIAFPRQHKTCFMQPWYVMHVLGNKTHCLPGTTDNCNLFFLNEILKPTVAKRCFYLLRNVLKNVMIFKVHQDIHEKRDCNLCKLNVQVYSFWCLCLKYTKHISRVFYFILLSKERFFRRNILNLEPITFPPNKYG